MKSFFGNFIDVWRFFTGHTAHRPQNVLYNGPSRFEHSKKSCSLCCNFLIIASRMSLPEEDEDLEKRRPFPSSSDDPKIEHNFGWWLLKPTELMHDRKITF